MKVAVIDVGSNSVRLMMRADGITLSKRVCTTRLGEHLSRSGRLEDVAIARTADAVESFVRLAEAEGAEDVAIFATAAVRSAENGTAFCEAVFSRCGRSVDVISGETEARIGLLGALGGRDGGILDIGGASTEVSVRRDGKRIYTKSVDVGTVRLFDLCGSDRAALSRVLADKLQAYGTIPKTESAYAIGGTATTVAAIDLGLEPYDDAAVDRHCLSLDRVRTLAETILPLPIPERAKIKGMDRNKLDVIGGGIFLLARMMELWGLDAIAVSTADNLEGYAMEKGLP